MFSIDIDDQLVSGKRDLDVVHMYVGNPGSIVSSGIAYAITATRKTRENFYFFFDGKRQLTEAADKITSSMHLDDTNIDVNNVLRPELRDCHTICVANKQTHDTAYFSGVNVNQRIFFLAWLQYPPAIGQFVETRRGQLDHLLYDVGFGYTSNGGLPTDPQEWLLRYFLIFRGRGAKFPCIAFDGPRIVPYANRTSQFCRYGAGSFNC